MIEGRASIVIAREPKDILEFVLDLREYAKADTKITRIRDVSRDGDTGTVRFGGRLRGIPGPVTTYRFNLKQWTELQFVGRVRGLFDFEGSFTCEPADGGTLVEHVERFSFKAPARWAAEPLLRRWLADDTRAEMDRVKRILEA